MNLELFPRQDDFRIVTLDSDDVSARTDQLQAFSRLVLDSEDMYPGIQTWLRDKVLPELAHPGRVAFLAYEGDRPAVSAVLKLGEDAKICHLNVKNAYQDEHLGELFFVLMALRCRRRARTVHFTLPESLWAEKSAFFESFGFTRAERSATQYRERDTELVCAAPIQTVLAHAEAKIPKLTKAFKLGGRRLATQLLMSVRPEFAHALMSGHKQVELRRRFAKKWEGARVALYSTRPDGVLLGEVTIRRVTAAPPARLWREFGPRMGCTQAQFEAYVGDLPEAVAIEVQDPRPYTSPISLVEIERWLSDVPRPPQSYLAVDADDPWGKVLTMVSLLHGSFSSSASRRKAPAAA